MDLKIELFEVLMTELKPLVNPLKGTLWGCEAISESDVRDAVARDDLEASHWDGVKDGLQGPSSRDFHVRRIAYFVMSGLPDDDHRIRLSVDAADPQPIRIDNGNHRIAAALIRGDLSLKALLYHFDPADVQSLLPGAVRLSS